jgi:hypothetical protein
MRVSLHYTATSTAARLTGALPRPFPRAPRAEASISGREKAAPLRFNAFTGCGVRSPFEIQRLHGVRWRLAFAALARARGTAAFEIQRFQRSRGRAIASFLVPGSAGGLPARWSSTPGCDCPGSRRRLLFEIQRVHEPRWRPPLRYNVFTSRGAAAPVRWCVPSGGRDTMAPRLCCIGRGCEVLPRLRYNAFRGADVASLLRFNEFMSCDAAAPWRGSVSAGGTPASARGGYTRSCVSHVL